MYRLTLAQGLNRRAESSCSDRHHVELPPLLLFAPFEPAPCRAKAPFVAGKVEGSICYWNQKEKNPSSLPEHNRDTR